MKDEIVNKFYEVIHSFDTMFYALKYQNEHKEY